MRTGSGPFDNDDATDFIADLIDEGDWEFLTDELEGWEAIDRDSAITAVDAARIVAAGEVLAALHGRPHTRLPRYLSEWIAEQSADDVPVRERLVALLPRVRSHSELAQAMATSAEGAAWSAHVTDLENRLRSPAAVS